MESRAGYARGGGIVTVGTSSYGVPVVVSQLQADEPKRILVIGSTRWHDVTAVRNALKPFRHSGAVLVTRGHSRGAEAAAEAVWEGFGLPVEERHTADTGTYKEASGSYRDAEVIAIGADLAIAFVTRSGDTSNAIRLAEAAGIPVQVHEVAPR